MNPTEAQILLFSEKQHLAIFEKNQVICSFEEWQVARTARNLAAHDYEINYDDVADH
jgi:hypothetical protein